MLALLPASQPKMPSSPPSSRSDTAMHIDLSTLPPPALIAPAPPSNTLLITNLNDDSLFTPASLQTIQRYLEATAQTPLHSFSPLKSLRRIIVSFAAVEPAVAVRQALDRADVLPGTTARVYFGVPTPVNATQDLLQAPRASKQFFISPPPSPPHGWTMRDEEPPNREVHAADLTTALASLASPGAADRETDGDVSMADAEDDGPEYPGTWRRGSSTVVYEPAAHGARHDLPAVTVEDTTEEVPRLPGDTKILEHTARPPVELMN